MATAARKVKIPRSHERAERITPLLRFMRAMTPDQKKDFAEAVGTTLLYLYQIAAQAHPNPRLQLARNIVKYSRMIGPDLMTDPLTYDDLLVGTEDEP